MSNATESTLRQRKPTQLSEPTTTSNATSNATTKKKESNKTHQRRCSYVHTEPPPVLYVITSQNADAFLAALGAGLCLSLLTYAADVTGIPVMGSFLLNTSVKMFYNRQPPTLEAFVKSTAFCVPAGTVLHVLFDFGGKKYAPPIVTAVALLYWKLFGEIWTAANSLAIYIAVGSGSWDIAAPITTHYPWYYVMAPYLTGHLFLYGFAVLWSQVRIWVRAKLVTREFFLNESIFLRTMSQSQQQERLRDLFDRMDLDHNGRLDAQELQLAFRSAIGCDVTLEESRLIIKSTDTDGDSTLDFHEFCAAIDKLAHGF